MLFDPRDRALASGPLRQPPPLPELPPEGAIGETLLRFGASLDLMRGQEQTISRQRMLADGLQPYLDRYEEETGEELDNPLGLFANPFSIDPERGIMIGDEEARTAEVREKYEAARRNPGDRLVSTLPPLPDGVQLLELARQRAKTAEQRALLAAELPGTAAGTVGAIAGSLFGAMEDPANLVSMMFGAPSGAGVLRTMATEAAVGATTELTLRPAVNAWQRELGKDPGFADTALAVATAGIGAGAFAGLIKGSWQAVRPLLTREQRAAVHVADAMDTLDRRNPFGIARRRRDADRAQLTPRQTVDWSRRWHLARQVESAERTVQEAEASLAEEVGDDLRAGVGDVDRRPEAEAAEGRFHATDEWQDVPPGAVLPPGLNIRMDVATGRQQARLMPSTDAHALHVQAVQEAEASLAAGQAPDGPAIRAIDGSFGEGDLELPVWDARTRNGRRKRWRGPMDIVTWARTIGGLKDDGGELKARDFGKKDRRHVSDARPGVQFAGGEVFLGRLVDNDSGISLDEAALRAWEAGYFPGHTSRPTPDDLLDAIDRTVAAGNDLDRRVWSEHDFALLERIRATGSAGRLDVEAEEHAREVLGDDVVDEALEAGTAAVIEEPLDPDLQALLDSGARAVPPMDDEAERMTLEALQDELVAGDFRVTQETLDASGNVAPVSRSAREVWQETQAEASGWRDAAVCMTGATA